ncbi:citrate synthase, mitochondrial [Tanacetum coccineum]|uniref:Citrate synthase, mitochondrial n=1 Tax=Tanacetum coccineum TaxID=301880 RepID=A0ABQ4WZI7_9ASTR
MAEIGCNWARIGPSKSSQSLSIAHKWAVPCESEFIDSQRVWAEYALKRQEAVTEQAFNAERLGDTLLPGMKLKINFRSGHRWSLSSWASDQLPTPGSFSLTVDPNGTGQLIILGHGNIHWTSGIWQNGHFEKSDPRWYIPGLDDRLKKSNSEYVKDQLGNIIVDMVLGGLRGMTRLLWKTSLLNPDEVLPAAKPGGEPLPEGLLWLLLTVKVLDAPAFQEDFYLNLVDLSSHNVLAVGLENCVYLSNACNSNEVVCGLKWSYDNREIASGGNDNMLPTHSVLSVVMDAVSEVGGTQHMPDISIIPTASTGTVIGDRQQQFYNYHKSASDSIYDVRSPVSKHEHTGHVLRASEGSIDAPADQNLRPTGRMHGNLMGSVYFDALS